MQKALKKQSSDSLVQIAPATNPLQRALRRRYGTFRGLVRLLLGNLEKYSGRLHKFTPTNRQLADYRRLVFVCQGNICRSAYADIRAQALGLPSASLGLSTSTGQPAFRLAQEAATRRSLDLTHHHSTDISDFGFRAGDLLLAMEVRQARSLTSHSLPSGVGVALLGDWSRPRRIHIHDPFELEPSYFDTCFEVIDNALDHLATAWVPQHSVVERKK